MIDFSGRRGVIHLPELSAQMMEHKKWCSEHRLDCEFDPLRVSPRPEWHGKRCTVLAKNGGVVRIDGVQSSYELLPMSNVILDAEECHAQ